MSAPQHLRWAASAAARCSSSTAAPSGCISRITSTRPFVTPEAARCTRHGRTPFGSSSRNRPRARATGGGGPNKQQQQQQPEPEPEPEGRQTLAELFRRRGTPLVAAGLAAAVMGGYIVMLAMSMAGGPCGGHLRDTTPTGRTLDLRQGKISASQFDKDLNRPENLMGVKKLRKLMGGLARGHVLEVAVGTGRNIEYVDWDEIKASAPPVPLVGEDGLDFTKPVKSAEQLHRERVFRRMEKGRKGMILPGDEAPEVLSYTGVDVSTGMLEVAWTKLKRAVPDLIPRRRRQQKPGDELEAEQRPQPQPQPHQSGAGQPPAAEPTAGATGPTGSEDQVLAANIGQGRIRLYRADAQLHLPSPPTLTSHDGTRVSSAPPYYDTILQNFGLCSVSDPHSLLANMSKVLQPGSGRIYLLEHGRGSFDWLNKLLDKFAPSHFERYGCWYNRDIENIVRRAEKEVPGLEVVRIDRPLLLQGGTMLWIELRVNPNKVEAGDGIGARR